MTDRQGLIEALTTYVTEFPEEEKFRQPFLSLLDHRDCFKRTHLPGHITGSAWIVNETRSHVLLTHHAKLDRWLQPGGHADGEENIVSVALREAQEETGLKSLNIIQQSIFDIDIHPIPARKDFPLHDHYDIRVLIVAKMEEPFSISDESHDLAWVRLKDLNALCEGNPSILRMAMKVQSTT